MRKRELTYWERKLRQGYQHPGHVDSTYPLPQEQVERLDLMEKLRNGWDEHYAQHGEGPAHGGGTYQTVTVTDDRGKPYCTFFIRVVAGAAVELFAAEMHRGLPPNPYVEGVARDLMWRADKVRSTSGEGRPVDPTTGRVDVFTYAAQRHLDWLNADVDHNPGQRPIRLEVDAAVVDGDERFRFPTNAGPVVLRGSVLAPALAAVRAAGVDTIPLATLRKGLNRM